MYIVQCKVHYIITLHYIILNFLEGVLRKKQVNY